MMEQSMRCGHLLMAKQHLEEMVEITKKIGFADLKIEKKNPKTRIEKTQEIEKEN